MAVGMAARFQASHPAFAQTSIRAKRKKSAGCCRNPDPRIECICHSITQEIKMMRAVTALVALLLTTTGCTYVKHVLSREGKQEKSANQLKATTNRVLLETFLEAQLYQPPVPPVKVGPYNIKTSWVPGEVRFEPALTSEPLNERKDAKKQKAVRVGLTNMTYLIAGKKGEQHQHYSWLDESEAQDFDATLSLMATTAAEWKKKKPEPRQVLNYETKGSFGAKLMMEEDQVWLVIRSGEYPMGTFLKMPAANISDIQGKLRAALKKLESS